MPCYRNSKGRGCALNLGESIQIETEGRLAERSDSTEGVRRSRALESETRDGLVILILSVKPKAEFLVEGLRTALFLIDGGKQFCSMGPSLYVARN